SPDTDIKDPSGYDYKDSIMFGFSHTHLSGTGLGDLGDVLTMPINRSEAGYNKKFPNFSSAFSHSNEVAIPGHYSVFLDKEKTKVDLTATNRCGFQKYTYQSPQPSQGIFIDLAHSIFGAKDTWIPDLVRECKINLEDKYTISGYKRSRGWAPQQNVYFVMQFNQPIQKFFVKNKKTIKEGSKSNIDSTLQAVVLFSQINELLVKTGISSTSIEGARKNLNAEIADWDFEKCKGNAVKTWDDYLHKIDIQADDQQKELFYTALYHTMLAPNLISDVDSSFFGPDFKYHKSKYGNYYSTFSLWDTYRAVHPLYTIICPEKNAEFATSMLEHFEIFGRLPIWTLWGTENYCMTGNPAIPVIVDAYLKGDLKVDRGLIWRALHTSSTQSFPRTSYDVRGNYGYIPPYLGEFGVRGDRNRYDLTNKYGYLPHDLLRESGTQLLELCYDDWCVAQMAKRLGNEKEYSFFENRAGAYKNIFDKEIGFIRPKLSNGKWQTPFDPLSLKDWQTTAFVEGNAFQYTFYVPHEVDTLIALLGGPSAFEAKLDTLFTKVVKENETAIGAVTGFIGQYAHGNEPSHHIAYLYNHVEKQHKTAERVVEIMKTQYTNKPSGLTGNDDCGQMSAWYVFSALGFYPVNPADGKYYFGTSGLQSATINLNGGKTFKINYHNSSKENIYIQKIGLNTKEHSSTFVNHEDIIKGGVMEVEMGSVPLK
ncbi:MAG TPA: GH92 family glycosyl hydrolase, partial [Cytophagaceae bacterium]